MGRTITNDSKSPIYVGNRMIPAGDTQYFPELPAVDAPAAAVAAVAPDSMAELQQHPVKAIVEGMATLTDAELTRLEQIELDGATPRKSLIEAITHERLARANAKQDAGAHGEGPQ